MTSRFHQTSSFTKGLLLGTSLLSLAGLSIFANQITIPSQISNAIQTIKEVRITSDGAESPASVILSASGNTIPLQVSGNMIAGTISGNEANSIVGNRAIVIGGRGNILTGDDSTIAGGLRNNVNGDTSFVFGEGNTTNKDYTTLLGTKNKTTFANVFMFGYSTLNDFNALIGDAFLVKVKNGLGINTGGTIGGMQITVNGGVAATKYCDYNNPTLCKTVGDMGGSAPDLTPYMLVANSGTYFKEQVNQLSDGYLPYWNATNKRLQNSLIWQNMATDGAGDPAESMIIGRTTVTNHEQQSIIGSNSFIVGAANNINGAGSSILGTHNTVTGNYSVALGNYNKVNATYAMAIGRYNTTTADGATAMGTWTNANGADSTTMGYQTTTNSPNSLAIGKHNVGYSDSLFEIGLGGGNTTPGNILTVRGDLNAGLGHNGESEVNFFQSMRGGTRNSVNISGYFNIDGDVNIGRSFANIAYSSINIKGLPHTTTATKIMVLDDNGQVNYALANELGMSGGVSVSSGTNITGLTNGYLPYWNGTTNKLEDSYIKRNSNRRSFIIGDGNQTADGIGSISMGGGGASATGNYATTIGFGTIAKAGQSLAMGIYNVGYADSYLEIGNGVGSAASQRKNILTVYSDKMQLNGNFIASGSVTAQVYYYSSDRRLKDNIQAITDPIGKISKLNGYTFNWKNTGKKDVGVIAQEVEKVFPELVQTDDKGMKAVEYANIVPVLIEAIKEQQRQINELRAMVKK